MFDFAAVPPEVNSGLMYAGAGAGPMLEAAEAWANLATELTQTVSSYESIAGSLSTVWLGSSAEAMQTAFASYTRSLAVTAEQCQQTATQALAAVTAYETAYTTMIPPAVVASNRTLLLTLIATNFIGQNTAAIAETEAEYAEFWAQDAAAMYAYAGASSAATVALPQFTPVPQVANQNVTSAATQPASSIGTIIDDLFGNGTTIGQNWQALVSSGTLTQLPADVLLGLMALMTADTVVVEQQSAAAAAGRMPSIFYPPTPSPGRITPPVHAPVQARVGIAPRISGMSTPPTWVQPPESSSPRVQVLPMQGRYQTGIPVPPAVPIATVGRSSQDRVRRSDPEYGAVSKVLPARHPSAG